MRNTISSLFFLMFALLPSPSLWLLIVVVPFLVLVLALFVAIF
jgi:hypothetical protein